MQLTNKTVFVTGANRGIGRAFAEDLIRRGAAQIYAAARTTDALTEVVALAPDRVTPIQLDVTNPRDLAAAAEAIDALDLLINNAGTLAAGSVLDLDRTCIERDMAVNFYGVLDVTRSLLPALERSSGALLNVITLVALGSMAGIGGYSASKAAAFSLTQSLRAELAPRGVDIYATFPGAVDTDMLRGFEMPKTQPDEVARGTLDAIEAGHEDSFPDPMAREIGALWQTNPKAVERQFASMG